MIPDVLQVMHSREDSPLVESRPTASSFSKHVGVNSIVCKGNKPVCSLYHAPGLSLESLFILHHIEFQHSHIIDLGNLCKSFKLGFNTLAFLLGKISRNILITALAINSSWFRLESQTANYVHFAQVSTQYSYGE
jgi:hypothetical protein